MYLRERGGGIICIPRAHQIPAARENIKRSRWQRRRIRMGDGIRRNKHNEIGTQIARVSARSNWEKEQVSKFLEQRGASECSKRGRRDLPCCANAAWVETWERWGDLASLSVLHVVIGAHMRQSVRPQEQKRRERRRAAPVPLRVPGRHESQMS